MQLTITPSCLSVGTFNKTRRSDKVCEPNEGVDVFECGSLTQGHRMRWVQGGRAVSRSGWHVLAQRGDLRSSLCDDLRGQKYLSPAVSRARSSFLAYTFKWSVSING